MRIAVTGAAGFLGQHLVAHARAAGHEVLAIVRTPAPDAVTTERVLADPSLLAGVDVVVHSAAIRHRYGASPGSYRASNVDLVEALLGAAAGRVGRFVHVSSVGVYGFPDDLPVSEASPYAPRTLYSQTKVDAEKLVMARARALGVAWTIVRPTIVYGPGDRNGMLDKLEAAVRAHRYLVVGSGRNTLHHTHIDDAAGGILHLALAEAAKNDHFIVAGPETITLARLGELVAKAAGARIPPVHVPMPIARAVATLIDVAAYRKIAFVTREPPINHEKLDVMAVPIAFDTTKLRAAGFTPRVGYEEGIARTLGAR